MIREDNTEDEASELGCKGWLEYWQTPKQDNISEGNYLSKTETKNRLSMKKSEYLLLLVVVSTIKICHS